MNIHAWVRIYFQNSCQLFQSQLSLMDVFPSFALSFISSSFFWRFPTWWAAAPLRSNNEEETLFGAEVKSQRFIFLRLMTSPQTEFLRKKLQGWKHFCNLGEVSGQTVSLLHFRSKVLLYHRRCLVKADQNRDFVNSSITFLAAWWNLMLSSHVSWNHPDFPAVVEQTEQEHWKDLMINCQCGKIRVWLRWCFLQPLRVYKRVQVWITKDK